MRDLNTATDIKGDVKHQLKRLRTENHKLIAIIEDRGMPKENPHIMDAHSSFVTSQDEIEILNEHIWQLEQENAQLLKTIKAYGIPLNDQAANLSLNERRQRLNPMYRSILEPMWATKQGHPQNFLLLDFLKWYE